MKYFLSLFLLFSFKSFSQIDTSIIFKEIRELKTDEMISLYWENLMLSDQNLHTFNNPVLQTENLLKAVYFFKYYGISKNCFYDKSKLFESNVFDGNVFNNVKTIWIHQPFSNLSLYTFSLIEECQILTYNSSGVFDPYYMQGVLLSCCINDDEIEKKAYEKIKHDKFKNINIDSLTSLALEFMKVYREIDSFPIEQGIWNCNKYKMMLYKTKDGNYYLDAGNYFKLKKIKENIFQFYANIDGTYFEIDNNGNLIYKDENGKMLNMYEKVILKY